jgi:hypothetical protein
MHRPQAFGIKHQFGAAEETRRKQPRSTGDGAVKNADKSLSVAGANGRSHAAPRRSSAQGVTDSDKPPQTSLRNGRLFRPRHGLVSRAGLAGSRAQGKH